MKKKIFTLVLSLFMVFTSFSIIASANEILSPTIVGLHRRRVDLPVHFYEEKGVTTYQYNNEEVYDFRGYFEILDNREVILDIYQLDENSNPIDKGGYEWDFGGFDLTIPGDYVIKIIYEGLSSTETASVVLTVIAEDVLPPEVTFPDYDFGVAKTEEKFLEHFATFLTNVRVYDKADGRIRLTVDDFAPEEVDKVRNAKLRETITLFLTVIDFSGNKTTVSNKMTIVDNYSPNIMNVQTLITKVNKPIDLIGHLVFEDDYSEPEDITKTFIFYGTLVHKNEWIKAAGRGNENKGELIESYLGYGQLSDFFEYVKEKELKSGYGIGDYYKVNHGDLSYYVYVSDKVVDSENSEIRNNVWKDATDFDKKIMSGKLIEEYKFFAYEDANDFLAWLNNNLEDAHLKHDYFKVRDIRGAGESYYVYIKEKNRVFRDEQSGIDFSRAGVQYVFVTAHDEYGNQAYVDYRVVIENNISLFTIVLIANAVLIVAAGAVVGVVYVKPLLASRKKGQEDK